jgi:hypothetical protein
MLNWMSVKRACTQINVKYCSLTCCFMILFCGNVVPYQKLIANHFGAFCNLYFGLSTFIW